VAHGGKNSKRRGPRRQMYTSTKFYFDLLFFENHDKLNIKKFPFSSPHPTVTDQDVIFILYMYVNFPKT
jgi:hypothetical protein